MRKVLVGLAVAVIVGVGGYFGFVQWVQYAAAREIGFVADAWRATIGPATRGRVEFDPWSRTLKISDVVLQSGTSPNTNIRLGQVIASGIDMSGKASRVEILDLETSDTLPGPTGMVLQQKAPRVTMTGFSSRPLPPRKAASASDMTVLWLEQFSVITAATIEVPSLTVKLTPVGGAQPSAFSAEYTYTNMVLRDVRDGRFAEATIDGGGMRFTGGGGPAGEVKGEVGKTTVLDGDVGPVLAVLDPSRPRVPGYQRVYRRLSMGPFTMRGQDGTVIGMDGMVDENFGLRPEKVTLGDLLFLTEVTASPAAMNSPAQLTMLMDKFASIYEGFQIGKFEARGFSVKSKMPDAVKVATMRVEKLENGKFGEISFEGLDVTSPVGQPFKMGRFALKGLDFSGIMRKAAAELSAPPGPPLGPDQIVDKITEFLSLLEGIEIKDVGIPDPKTGRLIRLDNFNLSWGKFVDGIPSQSRAVLNMSVPLDARDPEPFVKMLAGAGIDTLTIAMDVGSGWTEATKTLMVEPATLDVGRVFALSLKASFKNVTRALFSKDMVMAMAAAFQVEAGPVELTLRDQGFVDLMTAEMARTLGAGAGPQTGRAFLIESMARERQILVQANPQAEPLFRAVEQFVKGSGETLTLRLTPRGRVGMMQFIEEASMTNPTSALFKHFTVEASTGR